MLSIDLHIIIISSIGMSLSLKTKEFYRLIANKLFKKEGDVLNEFKEVLNLTSMGRVPELWRRYGESAVAIGGGVDPQYRQEVSS